MPPAVFASEAKQSSGLARGSGLLRLARKSDSATKQVNAHCKLRRGNRLAISRQAIDWEDHAARPCARRRCAPRPHPAIAPSGTGGACFSAWRVLHIRAAQRNSPPACHCSKPQPPRAAPAISSARSCGEFGGGDGVGHCQCPHFQQRGYTHFAQTMQSPQFTGLGRVGYAAGAYQSVRPSAPAPHIAPRTSTSVSSFPAF